MNAKLCKGLARLRRGLALSAAALSLTASAAWASPVTLRAEVSSGPTVTLGDLFDAAGAAGSVVIGRGAPAGQSAVLDAAAVQRIAEIHGLDWANPNGIRRIVVRSDSAPSALSSTADASSSSAPASAKMIDALTYARNLGAGDIVQPQDLIYAKLAAFSTPQDAPRDADTIIGKMVKRPVRAGTAVASHDVSAAQVIKRDDVVQVQFRADGLSLTLEGKAVTGAAVGEPVAVMNTLSKKVIQAIAVGPDQAVVGPEAEQLRAASIANPTQFAALH